MPGEGRRWRRAWAERGCAGPGRKGAALAQRGTDVRRQDSQGWSTRLDPSLIEILANLQEIDRRNRERELELAELERQSNELLSTLETKRQQVAGTRAESGTANSRRRDLEAQLQDAESKNKERRMRLGRIRNDKELIVAQREIEVAKEANSR